MANTIRIKRRTTGSAGAPASLENAELAFNEVGVVLYYGSGTGGAGGSATEVIAIGGSGAFCDLSSNQTVGGTKTFSNPISGSVTGNAGTATKLATARDISVSGDATGTASFDGSANADIAMTLATVNSNVGTYTKVTVNGKGLVTAAANATLDDIGSPTSSFSFNSQNLTNLADPVNAQDAATKYYVDSVAQGLDVKQSCVATTTGNITLTGLNTQAGGDWASSLTAGDRVLVKNQTASQNNGIYVASSGAWTRSSDANTWAQLVSAFTFVEDGATEADTGWVCTVNQGGTLGTTPITWAQFSGAGTYTAGTGLTLSGNEFSITNTAVTAGAYGAAGKTLEATVNAQGQLTALSAVDIDITLSQVSDAGTMAAQDANNVNITGGSIQNLTTFNGITIDGGTF
jgi:phage-related tail fiber protein